MRKLHELSTVGKSEPEISSTPEIKPRNRLSVEPSRPASSHLQPTNVSPRPGYGETNPRIHPTRGLRGRCWIRTNVGETDGFTDRSLWPLGQPAVLALTSDR